MAFRNFKNWSVKWFLFDDGLMIYVILKTRYIFNVPFLLNLKLYLFPWIFTTFIYFSIIIWWIIEFRSHNLNFHHFLALSVFWTFALFIQHHYSYNYPYHHARQLKPPTTSCSTVCQVQVLFFLKHFILKKLINFSKCILCFFSRFIYF